ncbi:DHA2 family efflux MFS transporter permease subunit [Phenylobacterium sp.]|jgi:DHA2 family multidrug resistance protein|uniref:DHA2 family efflux MFS transporter permease subunit n=1 Tax=Phenylobacterium sp. TaxID=1871053 RepID=UPI002F408CCB
MTDATADTVLAAASNRRIITASVMAATIMQSLDSTIANVALPHMQGELSATQDQMGWVLTSYIVAAAITIPLSGWLANAFGRRKVFLASIVLFTVTSALCGAAVTLPQIVLFRFLQGVGGAALVPLSQAVLFDINDPKDFGRAMAIWAGSAQAGNIFGPALGGWLTDNLSWRWVFYINLPIGVLAFVGLLLTMPESRAAKRPSFDFLGFATLSLGVTALQLLLDRGQLLDWFSSPEIVIEAAVAALGFYLFISHMFTSERPFLNPALFTDRNFVAANAFIFLIGLVLFGSLALLPPMLQNQFGYPVVLTGLVTAPRGLGTFLGMIIVGRIIGRINVRLIMAAGFLITAFALWQMTQFSPQMGYWPVIVSGLVQGLGIAIIYVPASTVAFATLSGSLRNEGTALFNLVRNLGSSVGISVVLFLLVQNTQRLHASLGEHVTPYNAAANPAAIAAHLDPTTAKGRAALDAAITHQSTFIAYLDDFKLMMVLTLLTLPFLLLVRDTKPAPGERPHVLE